MTSHSEVFVRPTRAVSLGALLGPDLSIQLDRRIAVLAPTLAAQLLDDDDRLVAQTVIDLMRALDEPPRKWWRSPLAASWPARWERTTPKRSDRQWQRPCSVSPADESNSWRAEASSIGIPTQRRPGPA